MKFLDEVNVAVVAGRGGNGCVSFRRERFIANGGPDGGNGGNGGSIYLEAEANLNTLIEFRYQAQHKATSGTSGSKRNRTGASGEDLYLKVPVGTEVFVLDTNEHIGDLTRPGQQLLVAQGGKGGVGNHCFKSGANRSPKEHTVGTLGEARDLRLSLKLLADVGLVGLPNAGKSTFIRSVSNAKPKVADYPFTTLAPKLGVVRVDTDSHFVIADIPGLIEGAAGGSGLGLQFLKHLERTKLLLHIVDIAPVDGSDPIQNIQLIDQELQQYGHTLQDKARWIVFNKLDVLPLSEQESVCDTLIQRLRNEYSELDYPAFMVSSIQSQGTTRLCQQIFQLLDHSIIS